MYDPNRPVTLDRKLDAVSFAAETGQLTRLPFSEVVKLADEIDADPDTATRKLRQNGVVTDAPRDLLYGTYFEESALRDLADASIEGYAAETRRVDGKVRNMARFLGTDIGSVYQARSARVHGNPVPYNLMKAEYYSR